MKLLLCLIAASALAAPPDQLVPLNEAAYKKTVADAKGKVVLVNVWATWCAPCRAEMPKLAALEKKLAPKGFTLITLSADDEEKRAAALDFLKKSGIQQPAYIRQTDDEEKYVNAIDAKWSGALPALFLYDRKGVKSKSFIGETPLATIEAAIQKLL